MDRQDKSDKRRKIKIEVDEDIANALIKLKSVGDTYSDVIRRILK